MTSIVFTATGSSAKAEVTGKLTSGMVGVPIEFVFDDAWNGLNIVVTFSCYGHKVSVPLLTSTEIIVPWECLQNPNTRLMVGAEGRKEDGTIVIPTVWVNAGYILEGADATGEEAQPITPSIYDQIMAAINAGKLKGEPGEDAVSPTVDVVEIEGGHRVTITDVNSTQVFDVMDGKDGNSQKISVIDDLYTKDPNAALSANMGAALRDKIDNDLLTVQKDLQAEIKQRIKSVNGVAPDGNGNVELDVGSDIVVVDNLGSSDSNAALSARMGSVLKTKIEDDVSSLNAQLQTQISQRVKTVNGVSPDENGNVEVEGGGASVYVQEEEPANAPVGTLWYDTDEESSGGGGSGEPGADGFSPIANVTQTDSGAVITVTDKSGTTTATVFNGKTPEKGVDYFTEADIQEIAEQAAGMVEGSGGGGSDSTGGYEVLIDITTTEAVTEFQSPVMDAAMVQKFNYANEVFLYVSVPFDKSDTVSNATGNVTVSLFGNYLMTWFSNIGIIPNPTETWTKDGYIFAKVAPTPHRFATIPRTTGIDQYVWGIGAKTNYGGVVTRVTTVEIANMTSGRSYFKVAGSRSMPAGARLVVGVVK